MAGANQTGSNSSSLQIDPNLKNQMSTVSQGLNNITSQYGDQLRQVQDGIQTKFGNVALNNNFAAPNFKQGLDATSKNMVSAGLGQLAGQRSVQNAAINQQFGGKNPALARILQAQGGNQSQLAGNGLNFQALLSQRQREGQEYQFGQQAQALGNQSLLSQQGFNNNSIQQGNAALQQKAQVGAAGVANQSNLLSALAQYAQLTGTQQGQTADKSVGNSPLAKLFNLF